MIPVLTGNKPVAAATINRSGTQNPAKEASIVRRTEALCLTAVVSLDQSNTGKRRFILRPSTAVYRIKAAGSASRSKCAGKFTAGHEDVNQSSSMT